METIVALATPAGNSGVAVIRISGESSKTILQKITKTEDDFEPRKMYLKNVYVKDIVDRCLVVFFKAPFSYTGEDVCEIQSHGGYFLAQKIIEECLNLGAKMADAGEFSKRAFINGKMSIDQAEGIMDLINAESESQARAGSSLLLGELKNKILTLQNELTDVLADIEAKLDYPEYEYTEKESGKEKEKIQNICKGLNNLLADSKNGLLIKNGVRIAIVGAPNVGKSSLLNALTKTEKAIVTNIAGTTRDIVEAEYIYNNIIFRLLDTAGIHESADVVEKIGIERAKKAIEDCDLILKISDENNLCDIETDKPFIDVFNKADLSKPAQIKGRKFFCISALKNENIEELKKAIFEKTVVGGIDSNKFYLTNERHVQCVKDAVNFLNQALEHFDDTTFDILSNEIKSAWLCLGDVTGTTNNEKIIDQIFAKFCLGK